MGSEYNVQIPWQGWQIVRRLGGGGFGTVYEIERDLYGDKERAAMKVIRIPNTESDLEEDYNSGMNAAEVRGKYEYIQKLMANEYKLMLELKGHTNIVNCHDFAVVPNPRHPGCTIYIRMELLTPLGAVAQNGMSESKIIQLGMDICKALVICEQKDIIHRDIKPDNILMSEFGDFKLSDFGIARTMEKTMSASLAGTQWYMAPEVVKKIKYGKDVDTYSLGLVLYKLLNHDCLPFVPLTGRITVNDMQKAYALRVRGTAIPEPAAGSSRLKAIVLKALAYDREKRYRSAKEMLEDLRSIANSSPAANPAPKQPQAPKRQEPKQMPPQAPKKTERPQAAQHGLTFEHKVFGVYMDKDVLHVRMYSSGKYREVLTMPAVFVYNELSETLTGNRAALYQKCRKDTKRISVLGHMKEAEKSQNSFMIDSAYSKCCVLMKELKKALDKITGGQVCECVITVVSSNLNIQRNVRTAMAEAGFRVLRSLQPASAYVLARSFGVKEERQFVVYVTADGESQTVLAHSDADILEVLENRICPSGSNSQNVGMVDYVNYDIKEDEDFIADANRGLLPATTAHFEDLTAIAANGAVVEGLILIGHIRDYLLLDIFPWKLGVEILGQDRSVCLPLTWIIESQSTIPVKRMSEGLKLKSGVPGKYLRLCIGNENSREAPRAIMEWTFDDPGLIAEQIDAGISISTDYLFIEIELKAGGKTIKAGFMPSNLNALAAKKPEKQGAFPAYASRQVLNEVLQAADRFTEGIRSVNDGQSDDSINEGILMIARRSLGLAMFCANSGEQVQATALIEEILTMADNLEYAIKAVGKSTDFRKHQSVNRLLHSYYSGLKNSLLKLNVTPVEAEGMYFDPYIHEALMTEKVAGVEADVVIEQIQKGYFIGDKLLRPAKVKVSE